MKAKVFYKVLAPTLVITGITVITTVFLKTARELQVNNLFELLHFMPRWVIQFTGVMQVLTYLPVFITGFLALGTDGAIGKADKLRTWSVYKYLRNPMYAGVSFTLLGSGLIIGNTAVAIAGLLWLLICYFVSLAEEKSLTKRFGKAYTDYKRSTPRFVPDFDLMFRELRSKIFSINGN